jgi:hypothetical protein
MGVKYKMDLADMQCVDYTHLVQDKGLWQTLVNRTINLWLPWNVDNLLTIQVIVVICTMQLATSLVVIQVFRDVTLCQLANGYQHFEGPTILWGTGKYLTVDMANIWEGLNLQHNHCKDLKFCIGLAFFSHRLKKLAKTKINIFWDVTVYGNCLYIQGQTMLTKCKNLSRTATIRFLIETLLHGVKFVMSCYFQCTCWSISMKLHVRTRAFWDVNCVG